MACVKLEQHAIKRCQEHLLRLNIDQGAYFSGTTCHNRPATSLGLGSCTPLCTCDIREMYINDLDAKR